MLLLLKGLLDEVNAEKRKKMSQNFIQHKVKTYFLYVYRPRHCPRFQRCRLLAFTII